MIEPKLKELLNRELDGELTSDERTRLGKTLLRNAAARKYQKELRGLATSLASLQPVEPPRHLSNRIRAAVHANDVLVVPTKSAWHVNFPAFLRSPAVNRYAYVAAGSLVLCLILFFVISNVNGPAAVGDADLVGTLVLEGHVAGFSEGERTEINADAIRGNIETQFRSGLCLLRINLQSPEAFTAFIQTDPSAVQVEAVRHSGSASGAQVTFRDGEISLGGPRNGAIVVLFGKKGHDLPPAHLKLMSAGRLVLDQTIVLEEVR
jgi:hypothetical protein